MKIAFNLKDINTSFGGGNNFIISLKKFLNKNGHKVVHNLNDNDIDIILILDPRYRHQLKCFGINNIIDYVLKKKRDTLIVQRINECDQRKNTFHINKLLKLTNYLVDHTIFIASWLKKLDLWIENEKNSSIILNGADNEFFNQVNKDYNNIKYDPLRIVTHHWSNNKNKGFDIYQKLDQLISKKKWKNKIEFTYIGRANNNYQFKNTKIIPPLFGKELAMQLKNNDAYITASKNEPAGMHHIEASLCGLPVLFRNSGALPEYCKEYGVEINEIYLEKSIQKLIDNFEYFKNKIKQYPNNSINMSKKYLDLFETLLKNKDKIILKRNYYKKPILLYLNRLNYFF